MKNASLTLALSLVVLLGGGLLAPATASAHNQCAMQQHQPSHPHQKMHTRQHAGKWAMPYRGEGRHHGHPVRLPANHGHQHRMPRERHDRHGHRDQRDIHHLWPLHLSLGYEIVL
ncbi:MAG: hypothetical protein OQL08_05825 [Gammaproteobacteria bacterium]|nr:hypothetical protein [Gammaproteobacteria bacterium]